MNEKKSFTAPVLLKGEGIYKTFTKEGNAVPVLSDVSIEIRQGERVAISGESGAGKSTLLHILGTLEPPTRGRVLFGTPGEDVSRFNAKALSHFRNRSLGFIFQFHYLLPEFNALENVMMPALIAGHSKTPAEKAAKELLEFVGLGHRLKHRPSELSGGEQQRIAIARAVILRPKILLADEPTGNLDSANTEKIMELLVELNRSTGIAILLVTHSSTLAGAMDRALSMKDGRMVRT